MILVPILMYHSISRQATRPFRPFTLSPALLASHLAYLVENRYSLLTVSELAAARRGERAAQLPPRPVVITFDDGFEDFYAVLPLLQRHHARATLYVTTGYVGRTSRWLLPEHEEDRPMLNWGQLRRIAAAGIECGAHTHTHLHLDTARVEIAREEILRSKQVLEQNLGTRVSSFAYPYGHYNRPIQQLVREAGFTSACAVKHAVSHSEDDIFALARLKISNTTDVPRLARWLNGEGTALASRNESALTRAWREYRRFRQVYN